MAKVDEITGFHGGPFFHSLLREPQERARGDGSVVITGSREPLPGRRRQEGPVELERRQRAAYRVLVNRARAQGELGGASGARPA